MRIRLKLSILELTMAFGFVIALSISLYYLNSMIRVKNMEYQAEKVVSSLSRFSIQTEGLLVSAKLLTDLKNDWNESVVQFESELTKLKESRAVNILGKERIIELSAVEGWWKQASEWQLQPVFKYLDKMIENGLEKKFGSKGILQTYYAMEDNTSLTGSVVSLTNYKDNVEENTEEFEERLDVFISGIRSQSELYIQNSLIIVSILVFVTIILSVFVINITARRISKRIGLVDEAVQTLTSGDFSRNLDIKSGDEFEELANHYNTFKGELWKKLDSILEFMLQIGESISEGVDINNALEHILDSFIRNTSSDAGAVFMVDEDQQFLDVVALNGFFPCPYPVSDIVARTKNNQTEYFRNHAVALGETIIGEAVKSGEGIFIKEVKSSGFLPQNSIEDSSQYIHSIAVIPLIISKRVLGAVSLIKTTKDLPFTDMEFTNMKTFGDYAALTIDNMYNFTEAVQRKEMQRELRIASDIQKNLLPRKLPDVRGYSLGVHTEAARAMSGDYYDIFKLDKNRTAFVICDVVGKGVPASLLMVMIRTVIRFVSSSRRGAEDILNVLNKGIIKRIGTDQYATLSVTVINEASGNIDFSNVGHSPLLHYSFEDNIFDSVDTDGLPVGVDSKEFYTKKVFTVNKNDIIILYTDGLPETKGENGSLYELEKLRNIIISNKNKTAEQIADAVANDIMKFKGSLDLIDDQTLIVIKAD
jgi:phosphoserine phosphatase RsbU/P